MNISHYIEKIYEAPDGFGVDTTEAWLKEISQVDDFSIIEPLFYEKSFSKHNYQALITIVNNKYINTSDYNFGDNYEKISNQHKFKNDIKHLSLLEDKSRVLDFSEFSFLKKINIVYASNAEEIILPSNGCLEALNLTRLPKLREIKNITLQKELKYLGIRYNNKLPILSFINELKGIVYLSLANNTNLPELDFLLSCNFLAVLQLSSTNAIKRQNVLMYLSQLERLRFLTIAANKKERLMLSESLPMVFM